MSMLSLNPQAWLAKNGLKLAIYAVAFLFAFGAGLYTMNRWNAGEIKTLEGRITALNITKTIDDGTITGLRQGIADRNKQIREDEAEYKRKLALAQAEQIAANERARIAQATAQKLLTNKPRAGQDVIMSGVDQVLESLP